MEVLIDLFLHFDKHLAEFVQTYGVWVYGALFLIIFAETGLVVTPFLPGDSLLFAAGALAATGAFNIWILVPLLIGGGDPWRCRQLRGRGRGRPTGLHVGRSHQLLASGPQPRSPDQGARLLREVRRQGDHPGAFRADRPDVRAIRGRRRHDDLLDFCALQHHWRHHLGGHLHAGGYAFGNVPIVRDNFTLVALGIVFVSLHPDHGGVRAAPAPVPA